MAKQDYIVGNQYSRLLAIELIKRKGEYTKVKCICDCGNITYVKPYGLTSNKTRSCGCLMREVAGTLAKRSLHKHGKTNTLIWKLWASVKQRCFDKNTPVYKNYGGRGITMCHEWRDNFIVFESWCIENGYQHGLQIDRIDNDGNYEPGNCRFVTQKVNCRNRSDNRMITYNGITMCCIDWAEKQGLSYATLEQRINRHGWDIERALTQPQRKRKAQ